MCIEAFSLASTPCSRYAEICDSINSSKTYEDVGPAHCYPPGHAPEQRKQSHSNAVPQLVAASQQNAGSAHGGRRAAIEHWPIVS